MLKIGDLAPNFSLEGDDSQLHSLKNLNAAGPVVLFFYPKDLTPGCTTEACEFSEANQEFKKHHVTLVGISKDSLASHARFKSKYSLQMLLLTDPDLAVHKQYFAHGEKGLYGLLTQGVIRSTFLIDESGHIARAWYKVRVKDHVKTVLETVKKMNAEGGTRTRTGLPGRF